MIMAGKKSESSEEVKKADGTNRVNLFMSQLEHPLRAEIEAVRAIILGVDQRITESIKWNAPNFFYKDDFATFNLRSVDSFQVIFHRGAKVKENSATDSAISDPSGLLKWLARDRCVAVFSDMQDVKSKESPLAEIVRQWIETM